MAVMMVANGHFVNGGSKWSVVASVGEGSGTPVAFLCSLFFFFFLNSFQFWLGICVGLEFFIVMVCLCFLDSCSVFFFKRILLIGLQF